MTERQRLLAHLIERHGYIDLTRNGKPRHESLAALKQEHEWRHDHEFVLHAFEDVP